MNDLKIETYAKQKGWVWGGRRIIKIIALPPHPLALKATKSKREMEKKVGKRRRRKKKKLQGIVGTSLTWSVCYAEIHKSIHCWSDRMVLGIDYGDPVSSPLAI